MLLLVFLLVFAAACLHGIANCWQWGHDGYNGAAFHQAARNSLRFGILGVAQYHMGLGAPGPDALYTHHPMALHLHVIASHLSFGDREWASRLVPALYSLADVAMLYVLVARFRDRWTATIAAGVYVLTPLPLLFATTVDHEQGAIFWMLAFFYGYLSHVERPSRRAFAGSMVAATIAMQFDWPAYYIAFFVAVHSIHHVSKEREALGRWGPRARYLAALLVLAPANLLSFFAWIVHERGSLEDMASAYRTRAIEQTEYLSDQLQRLWDLQGPLWLGLLIVWLALAARRFRDGRAESVDAVAAGFLFAQAIHSVAFPSAAALHAYWTYYLGPPIAIAGGMVIVDVFRRASRHRERVAIATVVGLLFVAQAAYAFDRLRWGTKTGHATYHDHYDDQFDEIMWAKEVRRLFPRPTAIFAVDPSIRRRRIEFDSYLDSPILTDERLLLGRVVHPTVEHRVILFDAANFEWGDDAGVFVSEMLRGRRAYVWNRRFVAIDVMDGQAEITALRAVDETATWLHAWLVNPDHPPVRWVPDTEADRAVIFEALSAPP